jgi:thiol-disulfide isomerase/thioredoxin
MAKEKTEQNKTFMFTAGWCPPCKNTKKMLAKDSNKDLADMIEMVDVETPEGEKLAKKHKVQTIPTFVKPDGERSEGAMSAKEMRAFFKK